MFSKMEFISWKDVLLLTIEEANHYLGCLQDKSFFDVDFDNSFYYSCWNIGIGWCKFIAKNIIWHWSKGAKALIFPFLKPYEP